MCCWPSWRSVTRASVAPTRRVALGDLWLPTRPAPGFGGILLAGIVGGRRQQPRRRPPRRARRADQRPRARCTHPPAQAAAPVPDRRGRASIAATTASSGRGEAMDPRARRPRRRAAPGARCGLRRRPSCRTGARGAVFRLLRRGTRWHAATTTSGSSRTSPGTRPRTGPGRSPAGTSPGRCNVLGYAARAEPSRSDILTTFRRLVRDAHPDHGGDADGAGPADHRSDAGQAHPAWPRCDLPPVPTPTGRWRHDAGRPSC